MNYKLESSGIDRPFTEEEIMEEAVTCFESDNLDLGMEILIAMAEARRETNQ